MKEWKKLKASEKKIKKYKDLYEKEKQRHEEALQRYQENHVDEMEIINLHKKCNKKARKVSKSDEPKKILESSKSDKPENVSGSLGLTDDPSKEEQKPKKASKPSDGKKTATKVGKKVKKTSQPKKAPKSSEFIESEEEEERLPKEDKGKKMSPLLGVKEKVQSFFDLQKDSKTLTIKKKVEKVVFMTGPYEGYELSYIVLCDTKYLKKVLKMSGREKKTKDLIKQALAKT